MDYVSISPWFEDLGLRARRVTRHCHGGDARPRSGLRARYEAIWHLPCHAGDETQTVGKRCGEVEVTRQLFTLYMTCKKCKEYA